MESKQRENRSKYNEHFEPINAPPEKVAKTILNTPPKKKEDWRYMEKGK